MELLSYIQTIIAEFPGGKSLQNKQLMNLTLSCTCLYNLQCTCTFIEVRHHFME